MTSFSIEYDGAGLRDGEMDVRALAPALMSLAGLFEDANRALNGERARMTVQVRAVRRGSFGIDLNVTQTLFERARDMLLSQPVHDAKEIVETLGLVSSGALGLVGLVRKIGKRGARGTVLYDEVVEITTDDDEQISVTRAVWELFINPATQRSLAGIVAPLGREGIDELRFREDGEVTERIDKAEVELFHARPDEEEADVDDTADSIRIWQVRALSFDRTLVWRFYEGDVSISAPIDDDQFWRNVDNGEMVFKAGDLLRVRVRTQTRLYPGEKRPRVDRRVVEVIEKIGEEPRLPLERPSDQNA